MTLRKSLEKKLTKSIPEVFISIIWIVIVSVSLIWLITKIIAYGH